MNFTLVTLNSHGVSLGSAFPSHAGYNLSLLMSENIPLSADLLQRLRLDRDADMSVVRAAESLRKSDRVKLLAMSASTAHFLVRASAAIFSVALQVVGNGRVQFKCECEAFKNGYICAHILASVQVLTDHMRGKAESEIAAKPADAWERELESVFGELATTKEAPPTKRPPSQRHLLFFSLQERSSDRWGVYPYSLPAKSFPAEFWSEDTGEPVATPDAMAKFIRSEKLQRDATGVRTVDASRFPHATSGERQAAGLLGAVASLGGYGYYYGSIPAGLYEQVLALLVGSGQVYHGAETVPLRQRVDILADNVLRPGVRVNTVPGGMEVAPVLLPVGESDEKPVPLTADKDKWAFKSPSYLLTAKNKLVPMPAEA